MPFSCYGVSSYLSMDIKSCLGPDISGCDVTGGNGTVTTVGIFQQPFSSRSCWQNS